jgi:hypothetical protein
MGESNGSLSIEKCGSYVGRGTRVDVNLRNAQRALVLLRQWRQIVSSLALLLVLSGLFIQNDILSR